MELWELVARESIRDLVARYNASGDSGRINAMLPLFSPQAVLEVGGKEPIAGRDAICTFFTTVTSSGSEKSPLESLRHHTATLQIDLIDKQSAKGRCYFTVYTQAGLDHWGRYVDQYQKQEGEWLFLRRKVIVEGVTTDGWADTSGDWH